MTLEDIDVFWVLLCACLVWIMQAGFLCLESGMTRSKNNINVALKNICDNATSIFLFWLIGFSIAFGMPFSNPLDEGNYYLFHSQENTLNAFFVFQAVFCSTCCTIVSGAAAERLRFIMYPILVAIIAGLIYPVAVNLSWSGSLITNGEGLLLKLGFHDFAGSTVVHSTGGWVALALVIIIGPRLGRFDADGKAHTIQGSNLTLSALGVLILWFGWMGFNGGSAYNFSSDIGIILSNTLIAGSASLVFTLILIHRRGESPAPEDLFNGALGGLVGITASADCVTSPAAVVIGAGSAVSVLFTAKLLLKYRLDDAVGAVPVHLGAGIWGTLAAGIFCDLGGLGSELGRLEQIGVQLLGILVTAVWAFGSAYLIFRLINTYHPFRVSPQDESVGLNISEHRASSELYELIAFMQYQSDTGNLNRPAPTDQFTELGIVGMAYNHVLNTVRLKEEKLKTSNSQLEIANESLRNYDQLVAHDLRNPLTVISSYAAMLQEDPEAQSNHREYVERIRRSSDDALKIIRELLNFSRASHELETLQPVELEEVLYNVRIHLTPLIEESRAQISSDCQVKTVYFNEFALHQVLVNLISNAIKYTPAGQPPSITLRSFSANGQDLVEVEDHGIGIAAEQCEHLFNNHQRLHAKSGSSGYGIGLFSAKKLLSSAGATISVRSTPGEGTCFTLAFKPAPTSRQFDPGNNHEKRPAT
ncbi:ammonium transporter [Marinobacterium lutimaris]|uniref:Ammonium transporter n=1 Tax=Marinobacterium lutimaris TaxID=568106 RepID=A0A1H5V602_9GAMM|nr:ammonium transporter [Marinobacterium lutimaris]SEF82842.1 ammonium transporter, Amt family [Marinobacterium lutimaris]